jgi:outer membrane scaffolding protein for murein synthesis (MipA/OmpV family)
LPVPLTLPFHKFVAVSTSLLACCAVLSQTTTQTTPAITDGEVGAKLLPLWELGVGVATLRVPDYRGSDESGSYVLPLPFFVYRGEWLRADREGARAILVEAQRFEVDVSLAAAVPARNNAAREGMPELPARVEFGPSTNVEFWSAADRSSKLELRAPLRAAFTFQLPPRAVGWTFNPHLNLDLRGIAGGWDLGLQSGAVFGNRRFHDFLYGVAASEATAQRPAYEARAGYAGWFALAGASRRFDHIWVGAFFRYDNLGGSVVAASPLVKTEQNLTFGIAASWIFSVSDRLVSAER